MKNKDRKKKFRRDSEKCNKIETERFPETLAVRCYIYKDESSTHQCEEKKGEGRRKAGRQSEHRKSENKSL